jgi:hypothetical protein
MYAFPTDLAVVCASRCHIQTSYYHPVFSVFPTSDLNMSRNETLGHREYWEPAKRLLTAAESAVLVAKDRENKEERLRKAREADRKKEKARKEAVFRSHAAAALEIEAAKE